MDVPSKLIELGQVILIDGNTERLTEILELLEIPLVDVIEIVA